MTEAELTGAIERSKVTALKSIRRHLPHDLDGLLDDIVQETYLRYYMTFRDSRPLSDDYLHRWIYVAARNECKKAVRKSRREGFAYAKLKPGAEAAANEEDTSVNEDMVPQDAENVRLQIEAMPDPFRETFLLRLGGSKMVTIAERLNVTVGTVKSRLARGKRFLSRKGIASEDARSQS